MFKNQIGHSLEVGPWSLEISVGRPGRSRTLDFCVLDRRDPVSPTGGKQTRNPNSEIRNNFKIPRSKFKASTCGHGIIVVCICFGFRYSEFGFSNWLPCLAPPQDSRCQRPVCYSLHHKAKGPLVGLFHQLIIRAGPGVGRSSCFALRGWFSRVAKSQIGSGGGSRTHLEEFMRLRSVLWSSSPQSGGPPG